MPVVTLAIELSNGKKDTLYYPSNVVLDYIQEMEYPMGEFIELASISLDKAQERVIDKFGHQCIGCYMIKSRLSEWAADLEENIKVYVRKITEF